MDVRFHTKDRAGEKGAYLLAAPGQWPRGRSSRHLRLGTPNTGPAWACGHQNGRARGSDHNSGGTVTSASQGIFARKFKNEILTFE